MRKKILSAAKYIINEYNGKIPSDREKLLAIPGVGEYVAGAILTVAFKKKEWVIDSNIARYINRYYGLGLVGEIRRKKEIINVSKRIFNSSNPRKLLFDILDFTALICKPRNPSCPTCNQIKKCKYQKRLSSN